MRAETRCPARRRVRIHPIACTVRPEPHPLLRQGSGAGVSHHPPPPPIYPGVETLKPQTPHLPGQAESGCLGYRQKCLFLRVKRNRVRSTVRAMGAAEDDQAKQGQLLRKALAEQIRFGKKTDQVRRWQKQRWIEVDEIVISNGRNACLGKYILEKRLYAFGLAGDICQALVPKNSSGVRGSTRGVWGVVAPTNPAPPSPDRCERACIGCGKGSRCQHARQGS